MKLNQIAINSVSTADKPLPELLSAYADAGFRNIEFRMQQIKGWMKAGHDIKDVSALLKSHGQQCIGGFEESVTCFGDAAAKKANHALHIGNAEIIAHLGGGVMVVGTDSPEEKTLAGLETIGHTLKELVTQCPPTVSLAVEFNWSGIVKSVVGASRVVDAAKDPRVGILFDPAHYHCTPSKFEHLTKQVVGQILHVHVDDMNDKPGDLSNCNSDRVLPGEGILDLRGLFGRLEEYGYKGFFSIELFNDEIWALPVPEAARRCFKSMQALCQP